MIIWMCVYVHLFKCSYDVCVTRNAFFFCLFACLPACLLTFVFDYCVLSKPEKNSYQHVKSSSKVAISHTNVIRTSIGHGSDRYFAITNSQRIQAKRAGRWTAQRTTFRFRWRRLVLAKAERWSTTFILVDHTTNTHTKQTTEQANSKMFQLKSDSKIYTTCKIQHTTYIFIKH